jgi:hypothetical protein
MGKKKEGGRRGRMERVMCVWVVQCDACRDRIEQQSCHHLSLRYRNVRSYVLDTSKKTRGKFTRGFCSFRSNSIANFSTAIRSALRIHSLAFKIGLNRLALRLFLLIFSIINMRAISIVSAAAMLASSVSASNDPRECEGEGGKIHPISKPIRRLLLTETLCLTLSRADAVLLNTITNYPPYLQFA